MRIAFAIERLDPSRGGRERSTLEIARTLQCQGNEITVLCQESAVDDSSIRIRRLGPVSGSRVKRLRGFIADVQQVIRAKQFEIVHAMLPVPQADIYQIRSGTFPELRAAALRRRNVLSRGGALLAWHLNSYRSYLIELEQQVMRDRSVLCLPVSQAVAVEVARHYGRIKGVNVVYNGVACVRPPDWRLARQSRRQRLGLNDDDLMMLLPANDFRRKGVRETLVAFASWLKGQQKRPSAKLVVIGRESTAEYQRLAARLGCTDETVFADFDDDISSWFYAADACLLLSWYDPCSRVILESVRLGVPSVTTLMNGASEILRDGAGVVVSSPDSSAEVISAFNYLSQAKARAEMSEACSRIEGRLSIDSHVARLQAIYDRIVRERAACSREVVEVARHAA